MLCMYLEMDELGTMPPMMSSRLYVRVAQCLIRDRNMSVEGKGRTCFTAPVDTGEDGEGSDEDGDICQGDYE